MLFKDYSMDWLITFKSMRSDNTQRLYKNIIENHLIPEVGEKEMNNISISDLQQIINKRISNPATCKHILVTLKQIFKIAKEEGVVDKNLYIFIQAPYYNANEKRALTKEEKIAVVPGTAFGDCGEGFLRISYAYSIEDLKAALERIESFIKKL